MFVSELLPKTVESTAPPSILSLFSLLPIYSITAVFGVYYFSV